MTCTWNRRELDRTSSSLPSVLNQLRDPESRLCRGFGGQASSGWQIRSLAGLGRNVIFREGHKKTCHLGRCEFGDDWQFNRLGFGFETFAEVKDSKALHSAGFAVKPKDYIIWCFLGNAFSRRLAFGKVEDIGPLIVEIIKFHMIKY